MRLTLRTLLAFLDNILEPEDRQILDKKVQESEFAQNLIRRTRETVNDHELPALDPMGDGMRQDPNAVAEYLDNTMHREQIEEFERQCIENGAEADARLAEVTSCHHILTMVLGDPVQFSASSRDRMYRIIEDELPSVEMDTYDSSLSAQTINQRSDVGETFAPLQESAYANESSGVSEDGFNPADLLPGSNVPDYLRGDESRSRWLPIVATTLVAAVVTGVLLILFEPNGGSEKQNASASIAIAESQDGSVSPSNPPAKIPEAQTDSSLPLGNEQIAAERSADRIKEKTASPPRPAVPEDSSTKITRPASGELTNPSVDVPTPETVVAAPEVTANPTSAENTVSKTDASLTVNQDPISNPAEKIEEAEETGSNDQRRSEEDQPAVDSVLPAIDADGGNRVLGRLVSDDQILLVSSDGFDQLRWLAPQSNLKQGHQLLALPNFRPNLSLLAFTVELEGGSLLEMVDLDSGGTPTVRLAYGRMIVRTNIDGGKFHLDVNDQRTILLTLNNTETAIGVEVLPQVPIAQDPETANREYAINIYALSGNVDWQEANHQGVIDAGHLQGLGSMPPTEPDSFDSPPDWLTEVKVSNLEKRAIPVVRDVLQEDRPVKLSFQELVSKRRSEVKRLALRCCAYIGYFDPLVEALGDENMSRHWNNCASDLQASVRRHPEYASRVREAIERLRSDQSADLYRMLWGYTNEGLLGQGQAEQLVGFLSSEDLDVRVLGHWNLKKITDKPFRYQPGDKSVNKRSVSVKRYENMLDKDEIKHPIE